jgi:hypothetical protein
MTTFDDKEKAAENKYARDQELEFKAHARAHKLAGLWAAQKMGLSGSKAEEYAKGLVSADVGAHGHEKLFEHIKRDLIAHGAKVSDHEIKQEIERSERAAREQIKG